MWGRLFLALFVDVVQAHEFCLPSQSCWPSLVAWNVLNASVSGQLIALRKIECTKYAAGQALSRESNVNCLMWDNAQHANISLKLAIQFPQYAIHVTKAENVQHAVRFAAHHHIRLTVKTTGHSYEGRSWAGDGLLVWLHGFNKVEVFDGDYRDDCIRTPTPAIRVQGGAVWADVYPKVPPQYQIVGGNSISVSAAGGYLQGGGHSPLSPSLGLAVDHVVAMEVVTADGHLRIANVCENPDLFFALRGGGGGTFGIVTSATFKLIQAPDKVVGLNVIIPVTLYEPFNQTDIGFLQTWIAMQPTLHKCWGGYLLTYICDNKGTPCFLLHLMCNRDWQTAVESIAPLRAWYESNRFCPGCVFEMTNYSNFNDWHGLKPDPVGNSVRLGSRIMPAKNFVGDKGSALAEMVFRYANSKGLLCIVHLGGQTANSTSVPEHFRNGQWHMVLTVDYREGLEEDQVVALAQSFRDELVEQAPEGGVYVNEMNYDDPDWRENMFAENYNRLVQIKDHYDPYGLFACHHCIPNSDRPENAVIV